MNDTRFHRVHGGIEETGGRDIIFSQKAMEFAEKKCEMSRSFNQRKLDRTAEASWSVAENFKNFCAILPPIEKFMDVDKKVSHDYIWKGFQRGDLVIVRVSSIREHGFAAIVLTLDGGKSKDVASHIFHAWCSVSEIPKKTNHEDVLLQFTDGDLVRCVIIEVNSRDSELVVSLQKRATSQRSISLGKIEDEDLPLTYRRGLTTDESYENILKKSVGFLNPSSVEYLMKSFCVSRGPEMSLMKGMRRIVIPEKEFADNLRKQQSRKVADGNVKKGVRHFKNMEYELALQSFNYALDMDTDNVDGLVARGALYANRNCFAKAIRDFDVALKIEPEHKNAKKYLTEVLVERAKQIESNIEDVEQIREVKRCYQKALSIDPQCEEARVALGKIEDQQKRESKKASSSDSGSEDSREKYATTARKLKTILQNDAVMRKRTMSRGKVRKRSYSSSSSSSSTESTSSSSSHTTSSSSSSSSSRRKKRRLSSPAKSKKSRKDPDSDSKKERFTSSQKSSHGTTSRMKATADTSRKEYAGSQTSKHKRSRTEEATRALIRPIDGDVRSRKSVNESRRRSSSDIKSITKENFKDILQEISMFESSSKTTG